MRIICACCGRQIVSYQVSIRDKFFTNGPLTSMGPTLGVACRECSKDLDENGLFPEELLEKGGK
jgi:hypothetical protein